MYKILHTIRARLAARILLEESRMKHGVFSLFPGIEGFVVELAQDIAGGLSLRAALPPAFGRSVVRGR